MKILFKNQKNSSLVSNSFGFLKFPIVSNAYNSSSDFVVTGVPFDMASSGRSGSKLAPTHIRKISSNLFWEEKRWPWNFNFRKYLRVVDYGDLEFPCGNIESFCNILQKHSENLLKNKKKMLTFGGDHFITLPILRAYKKFFGKISIIQFDAHSDDYETNNLFDHGTIFLQAKKEDLIEEKNCIRIGVRTEYEKNDFLTLDSDYINNTSIKKISDIIIKTVKDSFVYLTFDIDCVDPSYAPGTGTPVVGGISSNKVLQIIRKLKNINIIGMDIVEVSPPYDYAEITSLLAATIALEMLYIQAFRFYNFR
ncbi:agmatinase [bacterium endosymbiont of Pedicinus badii]|uniref:agmatinase n=1 Tax=bacterium endosymbiont of Pedicinus badii TaxID=1719126 RepID=UPI0009B9CBC5|nr:agmatinase [bacterium endosymbiont of Pedicinus badii]OQM34016.1 agmatinase [bacterium endosymbiont of Pedicinus badii]